jgi:uncharacterized protein (TIGR02598 family)
MNAVNHSQVGRRSATIPAMDPAIQIDGASPSLTTFYDMKQSQLESEAFSLVEVTLALGVAAFCLVAVLGLLPTSLKTQQASIQQTTANSIISQIFSDLRADVRLPPGLASHETDGGFQPPLHGHWLQTLTPDTLYFTQEGKPVNSLGDAAVFRATITYRAPPTDTTSLASITVSWPARVDPSTGGVPAGSVTTLVAVNR